MDEKEELIELLDSFWNVSINVTDYAYACNCAKIAIDVILNLESISKSEKEKWNRIKKELKKL